jgi:uncharacterized phage protein gp47/JayE
MSVTVTTPDPAYGVLPSGFSRMRLPEIRQAIIDSLQQTTGLTFETRPDSITGQFINVFAEREATLWELAESVYHAMYPISATGVNLDHSVSFAGVRRLFAQRSTVWCACYGVEGTIIAAGSIVRNQSSQDNFLLNASVTISRQKAIDATVSINAAVVGQEYWIQINQSIYRYVAIAGDSNLTIANFLYVQLLASGFEIEINANQIRIYGIESISFLLQMSTNISLLIISSIGVFTAEDYGPADVSANMVNQIVTTMIGWNSVNNYIPGHVGRNLETDDELRLRYDSGVYQLGAATLESIRANLQQNVPGILTVQVYENMEDVIDAEGRPPHSIEVIAYGGDPQDIAEQIYLVKAAGIDTFGDVQVMVTGSSGYQHEINFNRPTPVYIWTDVTVTLYNEEQFPDGGVPQIQLIVTNTGNNFGIGKDVIVQRFFGPIYANVAGIGQLDIKVARVDDVNGIPAPGDYSSANIPIGARELSSFDVTKVMVTILDARSFR